MFLVDDEKFIVDLYRDILEANGHTVVDVASDVAEGAVLYAVPGVTGPKKSAPELLHEASQAEERPGQGVQNLLQVAGGSLHGFLRCRGARA